MFRSSKTQPAAFVLGLACGTGGAALLRAALDRARQQRRRRAFFGRQPAPFLALGSGPTASTPEREALAALRGSGEPRLPRHGRPAGQGEAGALGREPLLLLGSPRHNPLADELQRRLELPFQFISLTPGRSPGEALLCLYDRLGQTYTCTLDPTLGEIERRQPPPSSGWEYDYGLLMVGDLVDGSGGSQRVIWAAGIHDTGTLGAARWALDHLDAYDWAQLGNACFLLRVGFALPAGGSLADHPECVHIDNAHAELVRGPCTWRPHPPTPPRVGLLCDLGNVLVGFERRRLAENLHQLLGTAPTAEQFIHIQALRMPFERGELAAADFLAALKQVLDRPDLDEATLEQAWCDIFWRNEPVIALLERLSRYDNVRSVLVSNTDPLRLKHCLSHRGLQTLFDTNRVVVSCDPHVRPKDGDSSMLVRALDILKRAFHGAEFRAVFIDDVRAYFGLARQGGLDIDCIHYQGYPQLVHELGRYGLYDSIPGG